MFRLLVLALAMVVVTVPSGAFAEVSPLPPVPTLQSIEWTIGPGILGTENDTRAALPFGIAIPVARVGAETELYLGLEAGLSPVWDPLVLGVPLLAKAYLRFRLSDATGIRLGVSSGAFLAVGSGQVKGAFMALATPAFDLAFTKGFRLVFEPALGYTRNSAGGSFLYYPRISLGFSL